MRLTARCGSPVAARRACLRPVGGRVIFLLVLAAAVLAGGPASAAASGHRPAGAKRTPDVPQFGAASQLNAVRCQSESSCWAVGYYVGQPDQYGRNEALHWNGRRWHRYRVPVPAGRGPDALVSIACVSARTCFAVGTGPADEGLVYRWAGRRWTLVPHARVPDGLGVTSIACASAASCWVVGGYNIFLHWNGRQWDHVATGLPPYSGVGFNAVTCVSANDCWAVGGQAQGLNAVKTLVLNWNGHDWSKSQVPYPYATDTGLTAVTCTSAASCWAVGGIGAGAVALHWTGHRWLPHAVPHPSGTNYLLGVHCGGPADCWAVGANNNRSLALHWNGSRWSLSSTPNPGGSGQLHDVRCPAARDCIAVGWYGSTHHNLALRWNGRRWMRI